MPLPCASILKTRPSFPVPRKSEPSGAGITRPEKRRRRFVDQLGGGPEHQLPAAVDREILDFALQEVGLGGGLEEFGDEACSDARRDGTGRRGDGQRRRANVTSAIDVDGTVKPASVQFARDLNRSASARR